MTIRDLKSSVCSKISSLRFNVNLLKETLRDVYTPQQKLYWIDKLSQVNREFDRIDDEILILESRISVMRNLDTITLTDISYLIRLNTVADDWIKMTNHTRDVDVILSILKNLSVR